MNTKKCGLLKKCLAQLALNLALIAAINLAIIHTPRVEAADSCSGPDVAEQKNKCTEQASKGFTWSNDLCRCVNTQEKEGARDEFLRCKSAEMSDEDRRKCFEDNAAALGDLEGSSGVFNVFHGITQGLQGFISGVATLAVVISFLSTKSDSGSCISKYIFAGAAVVSLGSEVYFYFFLENKLRDFYTKYAKYVETYSGTSSGSGPAEVVGSFTGGSNPVTQNTVDSGGSAEEQGSALGNQAKANPFEAQKIAFDLLVEEQKTIKEVSEAKKTPYLIAAIAFGLAAVVAIFELVVPTMTKCTVSNNNGPKLDKKDRLNPTYKKSIANFFLDSTQYFDPNTAYDREAVGKIVNDMEKRHWEQGEDRSLSLTEFKQLEDFFQINPKTYSSQNFSIDELLISKACAENGTVLKENSGWKGAQGNVSFYSMIIGAAAGLLVLGIAALAGYGTITRAITSTPGILVIGLISMGLHFALYGFTTAEADLASENQKKAEQVRDQFLASVQAYCPNGRENLAEPDCYCYLDNGKKNPNRTNSDTCKALWASREGNFFVNPNSQDIRTGEDPMGCMTVNRQYDAECKCKKFVDKKSGKNACYSVPVTATSLGNIGAGVGASNTLASMHSLANGSNGGNLNAGDLKARAARQKAAINGLLRKLNDQRRAAKLGPMDLSGKALAKQIQAMVPQKALQNLTTGNVSPSGLADAGRPGGDGLKNAIDKTGLKKYTLQGGDMKKAGADANKGMNFEFDTGGGRGASNEGQVMDEFMDKKYNFKDNDIVKNDSASIWQVISNRYNTSALPRLFGTAEELKAMEAGQQSGDAPKDGANVKGQ